MDLTQIAEAWSRATDREILEFLDDPADTSPEVVATVQREADRRGLCVGAVGRPEPPSQSALWQAACALHHRLQANPLLVAAGVGAAVRFSTIPIHWVVPGIPPLPMRIAVDAALLLGLAYVCWPLRSYRHVAARTLVAAACYMLAAVLRLWGLFPPWPVKVLVSSALLAWVVYWAGTCLVLSAVVFVRNRYWPLRLPGCCAVCSYDLRGLSELRCPECGAPFDVAVPLSAADRDA